MEIGYWTVPAKVGISVETFCPVNREREKELAAYVDEDERENLECMGDGGGQGSSLVVPKERLSDELRAELLSYLDHIINVYRVDMTLYDGVEEIIVRYMDDARKGILLDDYEVCCEEVKQQIEENIG